MVRQSSVALLIACLFPSAALHSQQAPPTQPPTSGESSLRIIRSAADIAPRSYPLSVAPSEVVRTGEGFKALADAVRKDDEELLRADIRDNTVRLNLEYTLSDLDLLDGNRVAMQDRLTRASALEEKPAEKIAGSLFSKAYANAWATTPDDSPAFAAALEKEYTRLVNAAPWDVAGPVMKQSRTNIQLQTPALLLAGLKQAADPPWQRTRTVDAQTASWIIGARASLLKRLPYTSMHVAVLTAYINTQRSSKPEIWSAREIHFRPDAKLSPVVIGIWDTGVDRALYKGQLDGKLSDRVLTMDYPFTETAELAPRTPEQARLWPEQIKLLQGATDSWEGVASPEADAYTAKLRELSPDKLGPFIDQISFSGMYMHGTHVAGIALRNNPAARLYVLRETMWWGNVPRLPSLEEQRAIAARYKQVFADFHQHHVRVVNLSWTGSVADAEWALKANGRCNSAEECRSLATEFNNVQRDALKTAMATGSDILFVCIPGNANLDSTFNDVFPGSFQLPNVLTVGAVDAAGDETSFTSFGPTVRLYANGDQVESFIPGGETLRASGTSMAAPQVTNTAGKLLAVDPSLSPEQVIDLLLRGSDASSDGRLHLLNPAKSMALLEANRTQKTDSPSRTGASAQASGSPQAR